MRPAEKLPARWACDSEFERNAFVPILLALAIAVVYSHAYPILDGNDFREPLFRLTGLYTTGGIAVNLFLAISGLLVSRSWERSRTTRSFLVKRATRIYPAFAAAMVIQAFIVAPLVCTPAFRGYTPRQLVLILAEIADLLPYDYPFGGLLAVFVDNPYPFAMNSSMWTIRYEFFCYLFLVLSAPLIRGKIAFALTAVGTWTIYAGGFQLPWHWVMTGLWGDGRCWPRLMSYFLAGALFYRFRNSIPQNGWLAVAAVLAVAAAARCSPIAFRAALPACGTYILFWFAYLPRSGFPVNIRHDFSYGTYLYAFPIQQSIVLCWPSGLKIDVVSLALCAVPLAVLAGAASWFAVERPILSLRERIANGPIPARPLCK